MNLEIEKINKKETEISYMSNGKAMIILLTVRLIKKALHKMSQYFLKPYSTFGREINVKVDLSNYETKRDLKHF